MHTASSYEYFPTLLLTNTADADCSSTQADWKFAAMVLDRICLILFSLFTAIATLTTLAVAPHVLVW